MNHLYLTIAIIFFVAACEVTSEINRLEDEPQLVVNSIIHPDTTVWVEVTNSNPIFNQEEIRHVEDAEVKILEVGGKEYQLNFKEVVGPEPFNNVQKFYTREDLRPVSGIPYKVVVESPSLGKAESETQIIPPKVPFDISDISIITTEVQGRPFQRLEGRLTLSFKDNGDTENYYSISVFYKNPGPSLRRVSGIWERLVFVSNDAALLDQGNQELSETAEAESFFRFDATFSDNTFNGSQKNIDLSISPSTTLIPVDSTDAATEQNTVLRFELKHVTKDIYLYAQSIREAQKNVDIEGVKLPFSEPFKIYSNIEGGQGIFGAYNGYSVIYDVNEQRVINESNQQ